MTTLGEAQDIVDAAETARRITGWPPRNGNGNGNGLTWKWLGGIVLTILLAIGAWAWSFTIGTMQAIQNEGNKHAVQLAEQAIEIRLLKEEVSHVSANVDELVRRK